MDTRFTAEEINEFIVEFLSGSNFYHQIFSGPSFYHQISLVQLIYWFN